MPPEPGSTDSGGASRPNRRRHPRFPASRGNHPDGAPGIAPGSALDPEASTVDRSIQAEPRGATIIADRGSDLERVVGELLPETGSVEVQRDTPGRAHPLHTHPTDETLHIVGGSITFEVGGQRRGCGPGDRLLLPAGTPHASVAGPEGCLYVIALRMVEDGVA